MRPRVTVLIDTFNQEGFIEQAIRSAIEQDFPAEEFEIVVVDDGSTDRTPDIIAKFVPRVRVVRKKNGGQASAFNAGFAEARGEIIALLDGDDWWLPAKLSAVVKAFDENQDIAAISHGFYRCFEESGKRELASKENPTVLQLATPAEARAASVATDFLMPSSTAVRRAVFEKVGPIPETLVICADSPIAAAAFMMRTLVLPEVLSCYRVHESNASALYGTASEDPANARRRHETDEKIYNVVRPMLLKWGARPECVDAYLDLLLVRFSRFNLRTFGGSHLKTFQTEMRFFNYEVKKPSVGYLLFKYLVMGPATLLLPPRQFYAARDWYYAKNLGRFRSRIFGT
jgi:glycosyltransferase involved in cell wall biosynthesis